MNVLHTARRLFPRRRLYFVVPGILFILMIIRVFGAARPREPFHRPADPDIREEVLSDGRTIQYGTFHGPLTAPRLEKLRELVEEEKRKTPDAGRRTLGASAMAAGPEDALVIEDRTKTTPVDERIRTIFRNRTLLWTPEDLENLTAFILIDDPAIMGEGTLGAWDFVSVMKTADGTLVRLKGVSWIYKPSPLEDVIIHEYGHHYTIYWGAIKSNGAILPPQNGAWPAVSAGDYYQNRPLREGCFCHGYDPVTCPYNNRTAEILAEDFRATATAYNLGHIFAADACLSVSGTVGNPDIPFVRRYLEALADPNDQTGWLPAPSPTIGSVLPTATPSVTPPPTLPQQTIMPSPTPATGSDPVPTGTRTVCSDNCQSHADGTYALCYHECIRAGVSRQVGCAAEGFVVTTEQPNGLCSTYGTTQADGVVVCNDTCKSGVNGSENKCYEECHPNRQGRRHDVSCSATGWIRKNERDDPSCVETAADVAVPAAWAVSGLNPVCRGQSAGYYRLAGSCYLCAGGLYLQQNGSATWGSQATTAFCEETTICQGKIGKYRQTDGYCYSCWGYKNGTSWGYRTECPDGTNTPTQGSGNDMFGYFISLEHLGQSIIGMLKEVTRTPGQLWDYWRPF